MPPPSAGPTSCTSGLSNRIFYNLIYDNPWQAGRTYPVNCGVCPTVPNGFVYLSQSITTGTSGGTEPTWPLIVGNTVVDGGVTWVNNGVGFPSAKGVSHSLVLSAADLDACRVLAYDQAKALCEELSVDNPFLDANTTAAQVIAAGATNAIVIFGTVVTDTDSAYNSGTGRFTVPAGKGGDYAISAAINPGTTQAGVLNIAVYKGAALNRYIASVGTQVGQSLLSGATVIRLVAGDVIDIRADNAGAGTQTLSALSAANWLSIKGLM